MTKIKEDADISRSELDRAQDDRDTLMKKLVETEMDGKAASEQVLKLRDVVRTLKQDKRLSAADSAVLTRQRETILQKLEEFDRTNKALRRLLRDTHQKEEVEMQLKQRQEVLLRKLTEADSKNEKLQIEIFERDRQIETLLTQVEADKDQAVAFDDLKKTMETTRAHLQNQFRTKEMENNRLQVQIRSLEEQLEQTRVEVEHLEGIMSASREKSGREKEALKKAARVQKDRVADRDKEVESLKQKLNEKELDILDLRRSESLAKQEKETAEAECSTLRSRIRELQDIIENTEKVSQSNTELLTSKLSTKTQEVNAIRTENEQLRADIAALEDRMHDEEQRAMNKIEKYRREAEESRNRLYDVEQDAQRMHQESTIETEKAKLKMQQRLSELEPLADLLKSNELRLQDSQDRLLSYERRASEHTKLIAELTQKIEYQTDQLETVKEKYRMAQDELRGFQSKSDMLDKKATESEYQNRELLGVLGKKEETLQHNQQRLEDLKAENIRLTSQLEMSLAEARRQAELQREKTIAKERAAQARITDLETQLSRATANAASMKRAKDEAERRFNSKLHDMKDRLEQANSTTRSMQNYVSFLKSSYADVFDELESPR
ncbi:outer dense fiber protein 2-like [Actinia tenebrosa]|uniref:Outer dense fiber protein 2-like n=1 Tax=Actinia tenebrosa TaxID=6105 RepID=A0A6P8IUH0_ACTTE|nr:outer dense fiber protein 2-like [Actinia tenebrosa]